MQQSGLTSATESLLNEFAEKRCLSKRAKKEFQASLQDGSSNWVDTLVSGCASKRKVPESAQARARVPRPTGKLSVFRAPALPSRKPQAEIMKETKEYEREQYIRRGPLVDGAEQRAEAQLLFQHGRKRLQQLKALEQERRDQAATQVTREPDSQEIREALVQQIFTEIDERLKFQEDMAGVRGAAEMCRTINSEVMQRVQELHNLGVDISSVGRRATSLNAQHLFGPMTAQDMVDLCSPPPFGEFKQSALHTALKAAPDLWNRLRNVDSDKEAAMLQSWQEHNAARKRTGVAGSGEAAQQPSAAVHAVHAWHRISKRGRSALLAMNIERVYVLEDQILEFLDSEDAETHIQVEDAFERCALHALASFHGMHSASVDVSNGRSVRLRPSKAPLPGAQPSGAAHVDVNGMAAVPAVQREGGHAQAAAVGLPQQSGEVERGQPPQPAAEAGGAVDRYEEKEADDRPLEHMRAGGACGAPGGEVAGGMQLPFTAVDVVAVLQEERQAQAALGRHVDGSLTVAALVAHRQEHLPAEMCHSGTDA